MADGPDFTPDDTQRTVVELAAAILDAHPGEPERAWKALGQAGLLALAAPEEAGGAGLGAVETALLLIEAGRRALAAPAYATLALGVLPVARWGTPAQRRALLAGLGDGTVLTAAVAEPGDPLPAAPRTTAARGWRVTGTKVAVGYAEQADHILVPVTRATGDAAVVVIDATAPGVTLRRTPASGDQPEYALRLDAVAAQPLGDPVDAGAVADLNRYAVLGACALGAGALAGALELTRAHVASRHQFGRPLATLQAVAQQIADVYIVARTVRLAVLAAAWRLGTGRAADDDLAVAAYRLADEAPAAARTCHHLHGGLGLDIAYPLHRQSALLRDVTRWLGGAERCLHELGGRVVHRPH